MIKHDCQKNIGSLFAKNKLIPVVVIDDEKSVRKLAEIFIENQILTMEITLRTSKALNAIEIIAKEFEQIEVGAGTILKPNDMKDCINAGAKYLVSPSGQKDIVESAIENEYPLLPAAMTVTESHHLWAQGFVFQKFFPAVLSGGVPMLKAIGSVLPEVMFCPTGGIITSNYKDFIQLPNVITAGSSALCSRTEIQNKEWSQIDKNCKEFNSILVSWQL